MSGFVWYSFGSDKTGPILGQALGFSAGKKTPDFGRYDVVIGWGCKPGKKYNSEALAQLVAQNQVRILNHPDSVEANRDKLGTLSRLQDRGIAVPGFLAFNSQRPAVAGSTLIPEAIESGQISFPIILLSRHNKGEPVFCYSGEDVKAALKGNSRREDAYTYARTFDQGEEYRIHVFRDTALCAQKKDQAKDPRAEVITGLVQKIQRKAKKDKITLNNSTLLYAAKCVAGEMLSSVSQLKKSTKMGWNWLDWRMDLVPVDVASLAIEALDGVGLDMGAVSISVVDKVPRVLAITTAPALTEEQMALYVSEVHDFMANDGRTKEGAAKKEAKKKQQASPELIARLYRKVRGLSAEKAEEILQSLGK